MAKKSQGTVRRADGEKFKWFPNGMKASLKAIRKFPPDSISPKALSTKQFADDPSRLELFNRVGTKYSHDPATPGGMKSTIEGLETNSDIDAIEITFRLMRFYAETMKIPTGLFAIFTHCVSIEGDPKSSEKVVELLVRARRAIDWLIAYKSRTEKFAFHSPLKNSTEIYNARVRPLYRAAERYNAPLSNDEVYAAVAQIVQDLSEKGITVPKNV